ncbi:tail assembly chaperone [Virgibacillus salexigens]|uniref:tail assembly chaperone n=1 Tax=Virgibacillus salexigens TaxID=61016 RepID=UPI00190BB132|nr:tail assembly chaperone [Virgibacillus salexigens]
MHINFKGREIELSFGLRTLTEIDKELGFEIEGANLGQGLEMLIPRLQSGNIIAISKIIKAATAYDKKGPKSFEDLEEVMDNIAENVSFEEFGEQVFEELGKRPMTRNLVPEELKKKKAEEKKED